MDVDDRWQNNNNRGGGRGRNNHHNNNNNNSNNNNNNRRVCTFYQQGNCRKGNSCDYLHEGGNNNNNNNSPFGNNNNSNNNNFGNNNGRNNNNNNRGGGTGGRMNTQSSGGEVCQHFQRTGNCKFGDKCRYSHDSSATSTAGFSDPFGSSSSPFGATPSSPFAAAVPSAFDNPVPLPGQQTAFGNAPSSLFGTPLFTQPQPIQQAVPFEKVGKDFAEYYFSVFCSDKRPQVQTLMRDSTLLTFNTSRHQGAEKIIVALQSLPPITQYQLALIDAQPGNDNSVVVIVIGAAMMGQVAKFTATFLLQPVPGGTATQFFISNTIQQWTA